MFSGIVSTIGTVARLDTIDQGCRLRVSTGALPLDRVQIGDSISVNGVCLTVTALHADAFDADVSAESLDCTTLGELNAGDAANLELALTLAQPLGGHHAVSATGPPVAYPNPATRAPTAIVSSSTGTLVQD